MACQGMSLLTILIGTKYAKHVFSKVSYVVINLYKQITRDWRGLAHLLELSAEVVSLLVSHSDPVMHMLTTLEKSKKDVTIKSFQAMMEQMDRWDVIDDTEALFRMYRQEIACI